MTSWSPTASWSSAVSTFSVSRNARGADVSFACSKGLVLHSRPWTRASWPLGISHLRDSGFQSSASSMALPSPSVPFLRTLSIWA